MARDPFDVAVDQIRSYGAVAVLGAGLSMARYPMTRQLPTLLAHALDQHPSARAAVAVELGMDDGPARQLLATDARIAAGWRALEAHDRARVEFQQAVARHDGDQEPLDAHRALARMIRARNIVYVVSFNWDTALERAYEQYFGVPLPDGVLSKPHGDATDPSARWVLPHEDGIVTEDVRARMAELASDRPRVLLVVGYSWSDPAVVDGLYEPVRDRWPITTASPSASGPEAIAGRADEVLPRLADALGASAEVPGWLHVTFARRRDIGAALFGNKLGPQDVDACPSVPAVGIAVEHLRAGRYAVITGDAGSGKSLAAFQAARLLNQDGWAVVELVNQGRATGNDVHTFSTMRGPVIAVVDDAQAMSPEVRREFERTADDNHAVLMVSTDRVSGAAHSTIDVAQAVAVLTDFCRTQRADIEPRVAAMDDRVGQSIVQELYLDRVKVASQAKSPWEFMFTLSGGDRRVAAALSNLTEVTDGPLLLGMLAAAHTLSLDAGVDPARFRAHAMDVGFDPDDVDAGIGAMLAAKLVTSRAGQLRTAHLRFAEQALRVLCRDRTGDHWDRLKLHLRSRVVDGTEPLLGRLWLMRHLHQVDAVRYGPDPIVTVAEARPIIQECLAAPPGRDRSIAGATIWELGWWRALDDEAARQVAERLITWIPELSSGEIYGVEQAVTALKNWNEEALQAVGSNVAPEDLGQVVSEHVDARWGRDWGQLILAIMHASGLDEAEWGARFGDALNTDRYVARLSDGAADALWGFVDLVHALSGLLPRLGARCIRAATPTIVEQVETDMPAAARSLVDWGFGEFLYVAHYLESPSDVGDDFGELIDALIALVRAVDWARAGASVAGAEWRDLHSLDILGWSISQIDAEGWTRAVAAIDFGHLDAITRGMWEDAGQVDTLVATMAMGTDPGFARQWVESHRAEIRSMHHGMARVCPELAVDLFKGGGVVKLGLQEHRWSEAADAIRAIAAVDAAAARAMVAVSDAELLDGLLLHETHRNMLAGHGDFVAALDELDPGLLAEYLGRLDLEFARGNWRERSEGSDHEQAAAQLLLARAADL
jgi:hypothetical protein